jgi:hypothetical protein
MKFWTAFISMFFITGILQAQIPYGANNLQPYYPGVAMQPYYPGATLPPYYPQAYYPQPYEVLAPYATNPISITNNNAEIDVLTRQVQQLTEEVMQLQSQLAFQQQPVVVTPAPPAEAAQPQPPVPATPITLVFKNGARIDTQGYAIAGQTLWILNPSGSQRVALSQLNVAATQKENEKRGIQFPDVEN